MFSKILVALDGSDPSSTALEAACTLAAKFDAELHIVHSPQVETTAIAVGYSVVDIPASSEQIAEAGKAVMADAKAKAEKLGRPPTDTTIGVGEPADDILEAAKLYDADLIVMGRRGLGSIASLVMGSVSQKVSHRAICSVLTVHH